MDGGDSRQAASIDQDQLDIVLGSLDINQHQELAQVLLRSLAASHVGVCLCDSDDIVRYANDAWRSAVFPGISTSPTSFSEALRQAVMDGKGCKVQSMPIEEFIPAVKARRNASFEQRNFPADLFDGRWWWISEYKLPNGWILATSADISSVKDEESRLRDAHSAAIRDARTDALTGLPNRRRGMELAQAALSEVRDNRLPLSVALLDIDHFKAINDTYGHEVGDDVLIEFANALSDGLDRGGFASRVGGEEFLVLLPGAPPVRAQRCLQRINARLRPIEKGAETWTYTFSAGIAPASHDDDLKSVLAEADKALYAAKANGRNRVEIGGLCRA